jgi:hypothetical protein
VIRGMAMHRVAFLLLNPLSDRISKTVSEKARRHETGLLAFLWGGK